MGGDVAVFVSILTVIALAYVIYFYFSKDTNDMTKHAKTEPAKTEPAKTEPKKPEPKKPEPKKPEPKKPEPKKPEPKKPDPKKQEKPVAPTPVPVPSPITSPVAIQAPVPSPVAQTLPPVSKTKPASKPKSETKPDSKKRQTKKEPQPVTADVQLNPAPIEHPTTLTPATAVKPGFTLYEAGDPRLGATKKRIPPVVTKAGKKAYQVEYKGGKIHPGGTNAGGSFMVPAFLPAEQLRVAFKLYYPGDFPWGKDMKAVGGKIFGFDIGHGNASGGNYSTTGASFRLTWNLNGGVGPYLYPELKKKYDAKKDGKPTWSMLDQSQEVQKIGDIGGVAMHLWYPDKKDRDDPNAWTFKLKTEQWNDIEMFCKLNTPGKQDGVLEVAINGVRRRVDSMRYRYDDAKIEALMLSTFFGGGDKDYAPPKTTNAWYADFQLSKT